MWKMRIRSCKCLSVAVCILHQSIRNYLKWINNQSRMASGRSWQKRNSQFFGYFRNSVILFGTIINITYLTFYDIFSLLAAAGHSIFLAIISASWDARISQHTANIKSASTLFLVTASVFAVSRYIACVTFQVCWWLRSSVFLKKRS